MANIDTYMSNVARKKQELAQLSSNRAKESGKIQPLKSKILSAKQAISRTKQESTIKSKFAEIERHEKALAALDKSIATIDGKIAAKEKAIVAEEKKVRQEQLKIDNRRDKDEKVRLKESEKQMKKLANEIEQLKYVPEKITVLLFATNPRGTNQLRLDEEVRSIQEMIRKSEHRDSIAFESRWAVRALDILQAINELNPDVVHFSGHGADAGDLVLENADGTVKLVTKEAIAQTIMTSSDKIHLLFFNTCFSCEQAKAVTEYVDAAIGMTASIGDSAAVAFAAQFYSSLGFGLPVQKAYEQAKGALMLENPKEKDTPALYLKEGVDANTLYIVRPNLDS